MVPAALRSVTFLTNAIVLICFIWVYTWLERDATVPVVRRWRLPLTILLTVGFLVFFHASSLLNIANQDYPVGYGWTYLNFQIITVYFALLATHRPAMLLTLEAMVGAWFIWMSGGAWSGVTGLTLLMLAVVYLGRRILTASATLYMGFGVMFALPFFFINWIKLGGIDVGWGPQFGYLVLLYLMLWAVTRYLQRRAAREAKLAHDAAVDAMTGLNNFASFDRDLQAAYRRFQATGEQYALFTFDIDHFKAINDRYGHLAGNAVLTTVGTTTRQKTRASAFNAKTYRTGGEEFSILFFAIDDDRNRALAFSRDLADTIAALSFDFATPPLHVTISLGEDRIQAADQNYLDLYRRADAYLYGAKHSGRDALTVRGELHKRIHA
ncbi:GGDEF domain-containing protein [Lacticaseibacillus suihuaensis]